MEFGNLLNFTQKGTAVRVIFIILNKNPAAITGDHSLAFFKFRLFAFRQILATANTPALAHEPSLDRSYCIFDHFLDYISSLRLLSIINKPLQHHSRGVSIFHILPFVLFFASFSGQSLSIKASEGFIGKFNR